jgi:hypothetical protein
VDHQLSHIFVRDHDARVISQVATLFRKHEGIAEVLLEKEKVRYGMNHERAGDVVLVSTPNSWQAYYYWLDDARAPSFARTVDIHQKPGYDPVELFFDAATLKMMATLAAKAGGPSPQPSPAGRGSETETLSHSGSRQGEGSAVPAGTRQAPPIGMRPAPGIPLDATLVRGSHGAPARDHAQRGAIISSRPGVLASRSLADTDVCDLVLRQWKY